VIDGISFLTKTQSSSSSRIAVVAHSFANAEILKLFSNICNL
jgi:hypothetical protein